MPGKPNDLYVIDADAHVVEGGSYLGEVLSRFSEHVEVRKDGVPGVLVEGRPYPQIEGPGAGCPADKGLSESPGIDPRTVEGILGNADSDGLNEMVLYPSFAMCVASIKDPNFAENMSRMYSEWVADLCRQSLGRLHAACVVPMGHLDSAISVMTHAKELGLVATVIPPALMDRNLDHRDFDRFYARAVELDMALSVHGAPGLHFPKIGVDRFGNYIQVHCISFPFDQMTAMTAMVTGGVFERHPELRVAYLEAGAGWLPWFVERLGEHFESRGDWIEDGWQRHPENYVEAGNINVTCEPDEMMLNSVVQTLGSRCVMFASDYPHWDGSWPRSTSKLAEQARLVGTEALCAIAHRNARAFYRLPERAIQARP